ncbi:MAG: pilin [Opitutaceae bacterium]
MKNRQHTGFTLVEVMIVVVIIGTIMTMALPPLHDRVIRTQVTEGFKLSEFIQEEIQEFYRETGRLPANNEECGLPKAAVIVGNFVQSVEVEDGTIHIRYGNKINSHANGKTVSIRPAIVPEETRIPIAWVTGFSSAPDGMQIEENNRTDLLPRHLPISARYIQFNKTDTEAAGKQL